MNVSCVTNKTAAPQRKILVFFLQDALKINTSIDAHREDTFFQNQGNFFLFSKQGRGDLPLPPGSCAPENSKYKKLHATMNILGFKVAISHSFF